MNMLLDDASLKTLQSRLTELLRRVHLICVENGICYTMMGGTLIGAIRHQGFIPWDDDIDIGMPYEDYKKFIAVVTSHKYEGLAFGIPGETEDYFQTFVKIFDTTTTLKENNRTRSKPKGIFIDVFPLAFVGDTRWEIFYNVRKFRFWRDVLTRKDYHLCKGWFFLVEWIYILLGKFLSTDFSLKRIRSHYEKLASKKTMMMADLDGNNRGIVPAYLFDEFTLYDFGNYQFYGMKRADEYLRRVFGDYTKIPPENQRIPHHIEFMDLNKSYLDD